MVFRPRAARQQLLDVIIQRPPSLRLTDALRVDILVVEIERHLVFPPFEHLGERRNAVVGHVSVAVDQPEPLQLLVGVVGHAPLAVGRAVDRQVVHEHHHAVLREAEIDLEEGRHHRQRLLARSDAVLGIPLLHTAPMGADDDVPPGDIAEIGLELLERGDLHRVVFARDRITGLPAAAGEHRRRSEYRQIAFHRLYSLRKITCDPSVTPRRPTAPAHKRRPAPPRACRRRCR